MKVKQLFARSTPVQTGEPTRVSKFTAVLGALAIAACSETTVNNINAPVDATPIPDAASIQKDAPVNAPPDRFISSLDATPDAICPPVQFVNPVSCSPSILGQFSSGMTIGDFVTSFGSVFRLTLRSVNSQSVVVELNGTECSFLDYLTPSQNNPVSFTFGGDSYVLSASNLDTVNQTVNLSLSRIFPCSVDAGVISDGGANDAVVSQDAASCDPIYGPLLTCAPYSQPLVLGNDPLLNSMRFSLPSGNNYSARLFSIDPSDAGVSQSAPIIYITENFTCLPPSRVIRLEDNSTQDV
ncbi:hypothetical protein HZC07_04515, partial [Candidatus Micrarchaeota archaeon]|nr:hypothetical protein [Candidatus Micrarchaeota archaeon]